MEANDETTQSQSQSASSKNTYQSRRSSRPRKVNKLYTSDPDNHDPPGQRNTSKPSPSTSVVNRPCDKLPDGRPFTCDICQSHYVCNPRNRGNASKRSRHMPEPRQKYDVLTQRWMLLCNACGHALNRPRKVCKVSVTPPESLKDDHFVKVKLYLSTLAGQLSDNDVEILYCPVYKASACGCLGRFITGTGEGSESEGDRARLLVLIHRHAVALSKEKCYSHDGNDVRPSRVGLGYGKKRSQAFEQYVLDKRVYLREKCKLCERATQKILVYSNNFLHKKLKTNEKRSRVKRVKGKAALGQLPEFSQLHEIRCCADNCVMMVRTHRALLEEWRGRAARGQVEARRVLAEMLTPTAGGRSNCYKFVSWVTGCSHGTICRVNEQMRLTGGLREPPTHALKKSTTKPASSSHDPTTVLTNSVSMERRRAHLSQLQAHLARQQRLVQDERDMIERCLNEGSTPADLDSNLHSDLNGDLHGDPHGDLHSDLHGDAAAPTTQESQPTQQVVVSDPHTTVDPSTSSGPLTPAAPTAHVSLLPHTPAADSSTVLANEMAVSVKPTFYVIKTLTDHINRPFLALSADNSDGGDTLVHGETGQYIQLNPETQPGVMHTYPELLVYVTEQLTTVDERPDIRSIVVGGGDVRHLVSATSDTTAAVSGPLPTASFDLGQNNVHFPGVNFTAGVISKQNAGFATNFVNFAVDKHNCNLSTYLPSNVDNLNMDLATNRDKPNMSVGTRAVINTDINTGTILHSNVTHKQFVATVNMANDTAVSDKTVAANESTVPDGVTSHDVITLSSLGNAGVTSRELLNRPLPQFCMTNFNNANVQLYPLLGGHNLSHNQASHNSVSHNIVSNNNVSHNSVSRNNVSHISASHNMANHNLSHNSNHLCSPTQQTRSNSVMALESSDKMY